MKLGWIYRIYLLLLFFAQFNIMHSQNPTKVFAGLTTSSFYNPESSNLKAFTCGIRKEVIIESFGISVGFGANYTKRGGKVGPLSVKPPFADTEPDARIYSYDFDIAIHYLELPLLVKKKYLLNEKYFYSFFFGGLLSFRLKDASKTSNKKFIGTIEDTPWQLIKYSEGSDFKNDYGIFLGTEFGYTRYSIEASYYFGFNPINFVGSIGGFNYKSHSLNILILLSI